MRLGLVGNAVLCGFLIASGRAAENGGWVAGRAAYEAGNYAEAFRNFQSAASQGDGHAMNYLGQMYASGRGVERNYATAVRWFDKAIAAGNANAKNNMGEMLASGWGVRRDLALAAGQFKEAADAGDATACFNLGKMRASGLGVSRDPSAAAELFRRALQLDAGNSKVHNWLGSVYYELGEYGAAVEQFKAIPRMGGSPAEVWHYFLGMSLLSLDELDGAEAALRAGLKDPPGHNRGLDRRAAMEERLRAIGVYKERYQRGMVHLASGNMGQARAELRAAGAAVGTAELNARLAALDAADAGKTRSLWALAALVPALGGLAGFVLYRRRKPGAREASDEERVALAESLADGGEPEAAMGELERVPRARWGPREYAVALRVCRRMGRFDNALALYADIERNLSPESAVGLRYYFALFCERAGRLDNAKEIYRSLQDAFGSYKDVDARLRGLEAMSAAEAGRVTRVAAAAFPVGATDAEAASPPEVRSPLLIAGRFEITAPLGRGGMGYVYRARDLKLPREVALKRLTDEIAQNPRAKAALLEEARTLARLSHEYIVVLHDIVEPGGEVYLVFECVEGETLAEIIAARGRLTAGETVRILLMACRAMDFAHGKGVVHRDLKPGNVMRDRKGVAKVLDFGLARHMRPVDGLPAFASGGAGTPLYMAPEQYVADASALSDIYSLGATAYEMLAGRPPFAGDDLYDQKMRAAYDPLPDSVPGKLRALIAACLSPDPGGRPRDMRAVYAALREVR